MASVNELIEVNHLSLRKVQEKSRARALRLTVDKLREVKAQLSRMEIGSWGWASKTAVARQLQQAVSELSRGQVDLLMEGLATTARVSARDTANYLRVLDAKYLGVTKPLRFDAIDWVDDNAKRMSRVRLREFATSFARYGAETVTAIEDEITKTVLAGETWVDARKRVWEAVRDVVGDKQWMVDRILRTETAAMYNGMQLEALMAEDEPHDPMMKRLSATFDERTGKDSVLLHGQTVPVREPFIDVISGRPYMAPPNRPNDREVVVGWRASYGSLLDEPDESYVEATATPVRENDPSIPIPPGLKPGKADDIWEIQRQMRSAALRDARRQLRNLKRRATDLNAPGAREAAAAEVERLVALINGLTTERDRLDDLQARMRQYAVARNARRTAKRAKEAERLGFSPDLIARILEKNEEGERLTTMEQATWRSYRLALKAEKDRIYAQREAVTHDGVTWDLRRYGDGGAILEEDTVLWVNVDEVDAAWKLARIEKGGGGSVKTRYADFGEWLKKDIPVVPPEIAAYVEDGNAGVIFANGRHRFSYFRDHGVKRIPVAVQKRNVPLFQSVFKTATTSPQLNVARRKAAKKAVDTVAKQSGLWIPGKKYKLTAAAKELGIPTGSLQGAVKSGKVIKLADGTMDLASVEAWAKDYAERQRRKGKTLSGPLERLLSGTTVEAKAAVKKAKATATAKVVEGVAKAAEGVAKAAKVPTRTMPRAWWRKQAKKINPLDVEEGSYVELGPTMVGKVVRVHSSTRLTPGQPGGTVVMDVEVAPGVVVKRFTAKYGYMASERTARTWAGSQAGPGLLAKDMGEFLDSIGDAKRLTRNERMLLSSHFDDLKPALVEHAKKVKVGSWTHALDRSDATPDRTLMARNLRPAGRKPLIGSKWGDLPSDAREVIAREIGSFRSGLRHARNVDIAKVSTDQRLANAYAYAGHINDYGPRGTKKEIKHYLGFNPKKVAKWKAQHKSDVTKARDGVSMPWLVGGHISTPYTDIQTFISAITRHELGHVMDHQLRWQANEGDYRAKLIMKLWDEGVDQVDKATKVVYGRGRPYVAKKVGRAKGTWLQVSEYALSKPRVEGLAETFALATYGKWDLIPEPLHAALRLMLEAAP